MSYGYRVGAYQVVKAMCKVKAGNFGKLVIPGTFLYFSVSRLIGVEGTRIDAEYGNNLSPNLLRLLSLCTGTWV